MAAAASLKFPPGASAAVYSSFNMQSSVVGTSVLRKEARSKVTGSAQYVDDLNFPGMLHGVTIRSTIPRGRILGIQFLPGLPWNEFTIVTARDIPGKNIVTLAVDDQPYLASDVGIMPRSLFCCWRITTKISSVRRGLTFAWITNLFRGSSIWKSR